MSAGVYHLSSRVLVSPFRVFPMRVYSGSFPSCSLLSSTRPLSAMICARSVPPWLRYCSGLELFTSRVLSPTVFQSPPIIVFCVIRVFM